MTLALWLIGSVLSGHIGHCWSQAVTIVTVEVNDLNNDGLDVIKNILSLAHLLGIGRLI